MADLDEVSKQIGSLMAIAEENGRKSTALFTKLDRVNEEVIEQRGAIKLLGQQLVEHKQADALVHGIVTAHEKQIEEVKNKGKGLLIGLSVVGGGGGLAGAMAAIKSFFFHT